MSLKSGLLKFVFMPAAIGVATAVAVVSLVWGGVIPSTSPLNDSTATTIQVNKGEFAETKALADMHLCEGVLEMVPVWLLQDEVVSSYENHMMTYINGLGFTPSDTCMTQTHEALKSGFELGYFPNSIGSDGAHDIDNHPLTDHPLNQHSVLLLTTSFDKASSGEAPSELSPAGDEPTSDSDSAGETPIFPNAFGSDDDDYYYEGYYYYDDDDDDDYYYNVNFAPSP